MNKRTVFIVSVILLLILLFTFMSVPLFRVPYNGNHEEMTAPILEAVDFDKEMPVNAARCAIVIDAESGNVLYSKNADEARGMASTTKIMTALVTIENADLDTEFIIPKEAVGIEGSSVYLLENEPLTVRELLYCLLLESGNDAATAIALCVGGSIDSFVAMMNDRSKELGLTSTSFANPHGLSDENHKTTARELAIITKEAMKQPLFREIVATKTYNVRYDGIKNGRRLVNHNKLLFYYSEFIGVKTGYTSKDGKCLVSAATKNGLTLIAVTLQDAFPKSTHKALIDRAFEEFELITLANANEINSQIPIMLGETDFLTVTNTEKARLCVPKGSKIEYSLILPSAVNAPIGNGEIIGYAVFRSDGKTVYIMNLKSAQTAAVKKRSLFQILLGKTG